MFNEERVFDHACLHLSFYLASWGMLRGGTFLLQKDYKVHEYLLRKVFIEKKYKQFYSPEHGNTPSHQYYDEIEMLIKDVKESYSSNVTPVNGKNEIISVSDTLASKILLGLFGIVPAYDRFFVSAMKMHGLNKTSLNRESLVTLVDFYLDNEVEFKKCRDLITSEGNEYTPMKLVDMYFWQVGYMMSEPNRFPQYELEMISKFAENQAAINNRRRKPSTPSNKDSAKNSRGLTDEIRLYIFETIVNATKQGLVYIDLISGEIHKELNLSNRVPSVCSAMLSIEDVEIEILNDTPSGMSSTKKVRYWLQER
ncbi:hypothetical protein BSK49_10930 [Paenibacillus odorifer]|uniref:hypothetical protein n=2 Tax=Paenibacillus TaxID=44249 RepID=UPI00096C5CE2|nr:hypothetical protein [Paenibacillus odorifer]OMD89873.1 hypothetical protein BSK49_10930 [Paenibacillus odorifer]